MTYKKITPHFWFWEFRPKGRQKNWVPSSEYQKDLLMNLAENLEVVRTEMPSKSWILVSNGVRTESDYQRLIRSGYQPSETSDHYYGLAIRLKNGSKNYRKYGQTYNFSMGAADCVPQGMDVWEFFRLAVRLTNDGRCHFGQVIYEKRPDTGVEWVHFGNDPRPFLSGHTIRFLNRYQFLQSLNGGKTYQGVQV